MKLSDFLAEQNLSPSAFASAIGVPPSTITRIVNNDRRTPRPETIAKIRAGTRGQVDLSDWFDSHTIAAGEGARA